MDLMSPYVDFLGREGESREIVGRLYVADRTDKLWGEEEIAAILSAASKEIKLALMLALWTGQRQGDLLRLPWSSYDGTHIRLRQSKTGRRIAMPAGAPLKALLDTTERRGPVDPDQLLRPPLDLGRVSDVVVQGLRPRRRQRPYVSRSQGHGRRAAWRLPTRRCHRSRPSPATASRTSRPSSMRTTSAATFSSRKPRC